MHKFFEGLLCYFLLINGGDLAHEIAELSLEFLRRMRLIDILRDLAL